LTFCKRTVTRRPEGAPTGAQGSAIPSIVPIDAVGAGVGVDGVGIGFGA
jgi:hypothetical protein